ncbi:DNA helicase UvrD, partial [Candidatus Bathyarchaeota archaeon]|nr:DNA helicase UvrD [Candidatus Bathyarchaeota archaeon]
LLPLSEIIASVLGASSPFTRKVWSNYNQLVERFDNEYAVLIGVSKAALSEVVDEEIAEAVVRVREGRVRIVPGYDGVYGKLTVSEGNFSDEIFPERVQQLNLTDFL